MTQYIYALSGRVPAIMIDDEPIVAVIAANEQTLRLFTAVRAAAGGNR
jgi:hypothetical protein